MIFFCYNSFKVSDLNMDICSDLGVLRIMYMVKGFLTIVKVLVPFILIIMASIDIYKVVIKTSEKPFKTILNRFIAAFFVFFIPTFINLVLTSMGNSVIGGTTCWVNANESNIKLLAKKQEEENNAKREAEKKRQEESRAENERLKKAFDEAVARRKEVEEKNNVNSGSSNYDEVMNGNFLENGKDGRVVVENGIFYKPASGQSGASGTAGSGPYGYNIYFYARLQKFIQAAAQQGYSIIPSSSQYGAWRPLSLQNYYWNCYQTKLCNNGNLAAVPGSSNHGWGIASDLSFNNYNAILWAHDNARSFGLAFPLCQNIRGNCSENWHIEPASVHKRAGL